MTFHKRACHSVVLFKRVCEYDTISPCSVQPIAQMSFLLIAPLGRVEFIAGVEPPLALFPERWSTTWPYSKLATNRGSLSFGSPAVKSACNALGSFEIMFSSLSDIVDIFVSTGDSILRMANYRGGDNIDNGIVSMDMSLFLPGIIVGRDSVGLDI